MSNKIYVIALLIWVIAWILAFLSFMVVYIKISQARMDKKIDNITYTLEQWELTK